MLLLDPTSEAADIRGTRSQNKNVFIRWAQLGSLVPIMENGGKYNKQHQPWRFNDNNVVNIYRYYANLHHELVPYLYSYDIAAHSTKTSILRPFGTRSSADTNSWTDPNGNWRYLLGDNFFVSAIYQDNSSRTITFPAGSSWINYWNEDDIHQGGTPVTLNYPLGQYPIFIRSGAIIPLNVDNSITGHGSSLFKKYLTLLVYPDGLSAYQYYTDQSSSTTINCNTYCGGITLSFSKKTASIIIRLKNKIQPLSVKTNGGSTLAMKSSFSDFESDSSGWFHGKIADTANVYTWIKFSNPYDTVYISTPSISNINPANYELSNLNIGNLYYVDRTYTLTSVPNEYKGYYMIKTANSDKMTANLNFHFDICRRLIFISHTIIV